MTLSIDIQHNSIECHYAECRYAECHYAECSKAECRYAECRIVLLYPQIDKSLKNTLLIYVIS